MRAIHCFFLVGLLLLVTASGCPWLQPREDFTSANTSGRGLGAPGGLEDGAEGESEGDPATDAPTREVVEPDVIRRAGDLLYVLNQHRGLSIVNLADETLVAQVPTFGFPRDLYVVGNRAYVIVGYATNFIAEADVIGFGYGTRLYVVDISTPAEAAVLSSFDLDGDLIDSRLVGDVLYAVSAEFQWDGGGGGVEDGTGVVRPARKQTSSSWVTSVLVSDPNNIAIADTLSFGGYGNVIQATNFALFVAASDWNTNQSTITYVDISDPAGAIVVRGNVEVPGAIADRFKMDAFENVLRVVSNTGWPERNVYVTTVDLADPDNLSILGDTQIPGAAGETLFATRFDGPRAYVVTYFMVDPLFVLDLRDPAHPVVAGELQVPGWSTHIEPRGDRLIALGVDDTEGTRRVKVSLFDVSNPAAPQELDVVSFGEDWSWSNAFSDVKAFTVLDDVLIVPFSGWTAQGGFERLQFVSHTPDDLQLRGSVDLQGQILRSFRGDDNYYGVTTEQVAVIDGTDLDQPTVTNTITLAEYVSDYQELNADTQVAIVSQFNTNTTTVRTIAADSGDALDEIGLDFSSIIASELHGQDLVMVTSGWDEHGYYRVVIVDCSTPDVLSIKSDTRLDVEPYWGGYWWYDVGIRDDGEGGGSEPGGDGTVGGEPGDPEDVAVSDKSMMYDIWYPWWNPGTAALFAGDMLALRCFTSEYDVVFGDETEPNNGLAFVDLDTGEWTATAGLAFSWVDSINAAGGKLYLTSKRDLGTDLLLRPICAYYIHEIDPAVPAIGPEVNVPGAFLQYDAANEVLLLEDVQYENNTGNIRRTLNTVSWDGGGNVGQIDALDLPDNVGSLLARGARVYFDVYGEAYRIGSVSISEDGVLALGDNATVANTWAYLLDAHGDSLYLVAGGNALARYDFSGEPQLAELLEIMSAPLRMRFGASAAYAPLGYAGVITLGL